MGERGWRTGVRTGRSEVALEGPRVYSREFHDSFWGKGGVAGAPPPLDVSEDERRYVATLELPGVRRENIAVELEGATLTIRGEKRCEREVQGERRRLVERSFGAFARSFTLPADADCERIEASLEDGVLTLTVAKRGERRARVIEIREA